MNLKYYKIDGMLICAENEAIARKRYKQYFHKKPINVKEVPRPSK